MATNALFVGGPYDGRAYAADELKAVGEVRPVGGKLFALMPTIPPRQGERVFYVLERSADSLTFRLVSGEVYAAALESNGQSFDVAEAHAEEWLAAEASRLAALVGAHELKATTEVYMVCQYENSDGNLSSASWPLTYEITDSGGGAELAAVLQAVRRDAILLNLRSAVLGLTPSRLQALGIVGTVKGLEVMFVERMN
jgi:hypothetical protein